MNTPHSTFPAPLRRLILCGGGGLAPAWGPLARANAHDTSRHPWDADRGRVRLEDPILLPARWSLPFDAESPWPARLALVAAWMASAWMPSGAFAEVILGDCWLHLYTYSGGVADIRAWSCDDGGNMEPGAVRSDLPTLPQHLQTHPPAVALVLALFDVPEIRARVEAP